MSSSIGSVGNDLGALNNLFGGPGLLDGALDLLAEGLPEDSESKEDGVDRDRRVQVAVNFSEATGNFVVSLRSLDEGLALASRVEAGLRLHSEIEECHSQLSKNLPEGVYSELQKVDMLFEAGQIEEGKALIVELMPTLVENSNEHTKRAFIEGMGRNSLVRGMFSLKEALADPKTKEFLSSTKQIHREYWSAFFQPYFDENLEGRENIWKQAEMKRDHALGQYSQQFYDKYAQTGPLKVVKDGVNRLVGERSKLQRKLYSQKRKTLFDLQRELLAHQLGVMVDDGGAPKGAAAVKVEDWDREWGSTGSVQKSQEKTKKKKKKKKKARCNPVVELAEQSVNNRVTSSAAPRGAGPGAAKGMQEIAPEEVKSFSRQVSRKYRGGRGKRTATPINKRLRTIVSWQTRDVAQLKKIFKVVEGKWTFPYRAMDEVLLMTQRRYHYLEGIEDVLNDGNNLNSLYFESDRGYGMMTEIIHEGGSEYGITYLGINPDTGNFYHRYFERLPDRGARSLAEIRQTPNADTEASALVQAGAAPVARPVRRGRGYTVGVGGEWTFPMAGENYRFVVHPLR